jgi:hypothetical protein
MDVKKANLKLLLGKIRVYLDAEQDAKKKGKRYIEAEKALSRLEKIFAGEAGKLELQPCRTDIRMIGG